MDDTLEIEKPAGVIGVMAYTFASVVIAAERWMTENGGEAGR